MTGRGVAVATAAALEHAGGTVRGARIGIQGFGLVGAGSAYRLNRLGANIVALADIEGAVIHEQLPVQHLIEHGRKSRRIDRSGLSDRSQYAGSDAVLESDVDVLILAAGSHSVNAEQAAMICAPLVIEGANFALTPQARDTLQRRGISVVPDVIASSSSAALVTKQMACGNTLSDAACWQAIEDAISHATRFTLTRASHQGVHARQAYLQWLGETKDVPPTP